MDRRTAILLTISVLLIAAVFIFFHNSTVSAPTVLPTVVEQVRRPRYETWPNWASVSKTTFTVLVLTFKQNDALARVLKFYCNLALVDRVIIVWNEVDEAIPENFLNYKCSKEIYFIKAVTKSLNNGFLPCPEIRTEAVLIVQNDQILKQKDIELGFEVWQNSPQLIVGFQASIHTYNDTSKQYGLKQKPLLENGEYSFISTATCFTHIHYLHMYTYNLPRPLFNFVEKYDNCEDIFFNGMVAEFLASNGCEQPSCIWVKGQVESSEKNKEYFKDINDSDEEFWQQRIEAMNVMVEEYGHFPLKTSNIHIYNP